MRRTFRLAIFIIPVAQILCVGCWLQTGVPSPTPLPVPQLDVAYGAGYAVAPGATIVVGGVEYADSAPVSEEALVGVVKNGHAYLYHPAMGDAELSEYNSRRAVGFFLAYQMMDANARARVADKLEDRSLEPGEQVELATGVSVEGVGYRLYRFTNARHRWVGIICDWYMRLLPPSGGVFCPDIADAFSGIVDSVFEESESCECAVTEWDVKTYCSMIRAAPLLQSPSLAGALMEEAALANSRGPEPFLQANVVDWVQVNYECLEAVLGVCPDCEELPIDALFSRAVESALVRVLTENDDAAREEFSQIMAEGFTRELAHCACEVTTAETCAVATEALAILATLDWVIDDAVVETVYAASVDAFASIEGIDDCPDDPDKQTPGICGCGVPDSEHRQWFCDWDGDGAGDPYTYYYGCFHSSLFVDVAGDECPFDPNKTQPGQCGCGREDSPYCGDPPPPGTPSIVSPPYRATDVSLDADLDWSDAAGALSYDVYFGTTDSPPFLGNTTSSEWALEPLDSQTVYYWYVVAKNDVGPTEGMTSWFRTGDAPAP